MIISFFLTYHFLNSFKFLYETFEKKKSAAYLSPQFSTPFRKHLIYHLHPKSFSRRKNIEIKEIYSITSIYQITYVHNQVNKYGRKWRSRKNAIDRHRRLHLYNCRFCWFNVWIRYRGFRYNFLISINL